MKKKFLILLILLLSVFTFNVNAKQYYSGEDILIEEQIEHSLFAAGEDIKVKSFIDGSAFIAGTDLEISSTQDVLFAAGEDIKIKGAYTKDAFIAGTDIEIETSEIRDLFVAGEEIVIKSPISNNANIAGVKVIIDSTIAGDLNIAAEKIIITENAKINGTLNYPELATIRISDEAAIAETNVYDVYENQIVPSIKMQISSLLTSYISILLIGFIILALFKKQLDKALKDDLTVKNVALKTALGLALLILIPFVSVIAICTIFGIPLAFILLGLYIAAIYLSIIPSGYYFANKLLKDKIKNEYAQLALGIAAIKLLELVPVIGGFVVFISLCFGISSFFDIRKKHKK